MDQHSGQRADGGLQIRDVNMAVGMETPENADVFSNSNSNEDCPAGSSLWECAPGAPEEWLNGWEGRMETHSMFRHSYE